MAATLVILDLDGTVYRGAEAIPGAAEAVRRLEEDGIRVAYVTNNSAATREGLVTKLNGMGFAATPDAVFGSGISSPAALLRRGWQSAWVLGDGGLRHSLQEGGVEVDPPGRADCVLVGIHRELTYTRLAEAMRRVTVDGSVFVATNRDATFPMEGGFAPGAGTIVAALATAVGREPELIIGKPSPELMREAMHWAGATPETTLAVGDRLDTDIASGLAAGCATLLVMTGVERVAPFGLTSLPSVADLSPDQARMASTRPS